MLFRSLSRLVMEKPDAQRSPEVPVRNGWAALCLLWAGQGLGAGRLPGAPGTWGSLPGVFALWSLSALQTPWLAATLGWLATLAAVPVCGCAERILKRTDPPSIVLDEIVGLVSGVPLGVAAVQSLRTGHVVIPFQNWPVDGWPGWLAVFVTFRIFDIMKPPPVRQLQALHGGWGIVIDDVAAGVYSGMLTALLVS